MPMNVRVPVPVRETQAAEGLPRRGFTVAEVESMLEAGILQEDERVELVGGELVPMSPKGSFHEAMKLALLDEWYRRRPPSWQLIPETTLRLSVDTFLEPDLLVFPQSVPLKQLRGPDVILAVEIADTSLGYDLGRKPRLYASFGVPELWVIDAKRRVTHVHRARGPEGYAEVSVHQTGESIAPLGASGLTLCLADLSLDD